MSTPFKPLPALPPNTPKAAAMLLAAGRGERMRPLTDVTPKPLLQVRGRALMVWCLQRMAESGLKDVVINTAWLGEQIPAALGNAGPAELMGHPLDLHYSHEGLDFGGALETAGGIVRALPWLGDVFWVAAGDVFAPDFVFDTTAPIRLASSTCLAHLWLVPNPPHNPRGDFGLSEHGLALNLPAEHSGPRYTFSTMALYKQALFQPPWCDIPRGNPQGTKAALAPLLRRAMDAGLVSASLYTGAWTDVGTPERLVELNRV
jgi:MurNAc alpha-1-phosphate uridylyltransferase